MNRRRAAFLTIAGSVTVAAAALTYRALRLANIGAAYKAKILCSGTFVSHREADSILNCDLSADNLSILGNVAADIDYEKREVTTSVIFGAIKRKARYTPGLGCSLCYHSVPPLTPPPDISPPAATALPERFDPRLDEVLDRAFSEPDPAHLRRTRAVVILHEGRIVAERYAAGFGRDTPLLGWSMTKAVVNALAGILVKQGRLSLDGPLAVAEWQTPDDPRGKITLKNLLQMSSGLRFNENYSPLQDVTYMLLTVPDAAAYAANKPLAAEPGTTWSYSSGTTNIISRIIRRVLGDGEYHAFPRRALFNPIGMAGAVIEPDASGTFVGSSFMYATARDWARFGELYLQDGVWNGKRILPEGWVKFSTTPAPHAPGKQYGAHLWLKIPPDFGSGDPGVMVPADAFHAVGHEGQFVTVIPSRQLVIVRLGLTRYPSAWQHDRFVEAVIKSLPSGEQ